MAVSCFQCEYLLNILEEQFVLNGGDIQWLIQGLEDKRIKKFGELNEILAFQPWKLSSSHIERLLMKS
jgi:hypothetical protein